MELLILLIIVVVLCLILDVSMNVIVLGLIALIGMVSGLFALAFLGCVICLLGCKRKTATFLRIDNAKGSKFQVAYYMVDGREYPCIFPKEVVLENKLYRTDSIRPLCNNNMCFRADGREYIMCGCLLLLVKINGRHIGD